MRPEDLRAFARRSWDLLGASKLSLQVERYRESGPNGALARAQRLRERFRRLHPEGASAASRAADLEGHVAVRELLDRAARAIPRR